MTRVLHISDPHFGTEQPPVVEALVALAHALSPDVIVMSGDITQRARRAEFEAARRFVERLPAVPRAVLPGNHDIPLFNLFGRLFDPYGGFRRAFGTVLEPVVELPTLLVLGVNTTRFWRHIDGEVSAAQVARVAGRLRAADAAQWRLVVTHQPLHVPDRRDEHNLLHGHGRAIGAWAQAGADIVMGGHIHLPYVRPLHERHHRLGRKVWAVHAGTAVSSRVRGRVPNSVNLLQLDAQACVERWDYGEGGRFSCVERTPIARDHRQDA
ncbi:MAG TPA: metallophosphoesterase family protein [Fontimonas sp.]